MRNFSIGLIVGLCLLSVGWSQGDLLLTNNPIYRDAVYSVDEMPSAVSLAGFGVYYSGGDYNERQAVELIDGKLYITYYHHNNTTMCAVEHPPGYECHYGDYAYKDVYISKDGVIVKEKTIRGEIIPEQVKRTPMRIEWSESK